LLITGNCQLSTVNFSEPADTIAAISTPLGEAGIGIVRLSGPRAEAIARSLFRPRNPDCPWHSHHLYLGRLIAPDGRVIDEVLLTLMRGPHTYTREDVVEINCHSGYGVLRRILELALSKGARLARPGEFTLRAFLSGRLDLTQAEAVLEVIQARTAASLQVAAAHLEGGLGRHLREIREALLDSLARVEAALDFPEEAEELSPGAMAPAITEQALGLQGLLGTYQQGRLLREGLLVVIAGRPNVGKSSLLNRLLNLERAIVSEIPGTTRDFIEESITLSGVPVRLMDTAGLRAARDRVEEMGVERTRERLAQANIILYLVDGSQPLEDADCLGLAELTGRPALAVINKIDLPLKLSPAQLEEAASLPVAQISALTGAGIEDLKSRIQELALGGGVRTEGEILTRARHYHHLQHCCHCLDQALALLEQTPVPWELTALELQEAIRELGEITGEEVGDAVLDRIFGEFCIGK
jgi:tRNA modification GTPase